MARSYGTYVESNFSGGLVTEASGLNFPENAVTDTNNCVFNDDGSVERRLGIDFESGYATTTISKSSAATNEYRWDSAGGDGTISFVVNQIGSTLYFYRVSTSGSLSSNRHATTISLATYKITGAPDTKTDPCEFTSGKGYLFVTHRYCNPFYVQYNSQTNTFTSTAIQIRTRDFEGVNDGLETSDRPNTLSAAHRYNLLNQGWEGSARQQDSTDTYQNKITTFNSLIGDYPSNADIWFLGLDAEDLFKPHKVYNKIELGNTPAPKGHFVLDPFDTDRTAETTGAVTEKTSGYERPSNCAFFAGRVFFSGVKANGYAGEVYFSQIIETEDQFAKCYQSNDPTSQHNSDLLPTDGGVIRILDAGEIYALFPSQKALIVFSSNGVWAISGSESTTFTAEDYMVRKIASLTNISPNSIVDTLGAPLFWTTNAIWTVAYDQGEYVLQNLTDLKIKGFLQNIPGASTYWTKGDYNRRTGVVTWLYRSTAPTTVDERTEFDKALSLNTKTGAFYPWSFTVDVNKLHGIVACENTNKEIVLKFLTSKSSGATTWAEVFDSDYIDWDVDGSTAYDSYLFSGYKPAGEGNKEFQSNYVVFHLETVSGASAFVRGIWDFSNNSLSNKWTTAQQVYNSAPTYRDYRMRKLKIRGWGKALQFYIYSEAGKPFRLTGWSVSISANQLP